MTWSATDPQGNETAKTRWRAVPYTRGSGIDIGCGQEKIWPHAIGVDSNKDLQLFNMQAKADIYIEEDKLDGLFAPGAFDYVFSSHLLEHIPYDKVPETLRRWVKLVKPNGYLVLYLPDEDEYPRVGAPDANIDHKWNVNYERLTAAMEKVTRDWDLVDFQKCSEGREYSLFFAFQIK